MSVDPADLRRLAILLMGLSRRAADALEAAHAVVEAARAIDVHAWDTCEFHGYATGICTCGFKDFRDRLASYDKLRGGDEP
jgi:hypothetical protein